MAGIGKKSRREKKIATEGPLRILDRTEYIFHTLA
jgi:hypothetical protein